MSVLTADQRKILREQLLNQLSPLPNPRDWLHAAVGPQFVRGLNWNYEPPTLCEMVLLRAEKFGRYETPPWLYSLAESLVQTEEVAAVLADLSAEPLDKPPDPLASRWVSFGMPFLDRLELREKISDLVPLDGYGVLRVVGPRQSGKSYTAELIDHLSDALIHSEENENRFEVAHVAVDPGSGAVFDPLMLASRLISAMGQPLTLPTRHAETDRWIQELCNGIIGQAGMTDKRWWWVLDGFCAPDLEEDTRKLVRELANRVTSGSARRRYRLVLLDYPEQIPGVLRRKIREETLSPSDGIGELDVRDHLEHLFERLGDTVEQEVIDQLTSRIVTDLPADDTRLAVLSERLTAETEPLLDRLGLT